MSRLEIFTEDLFDGDAWAGPATILVEDGRIQSVQAGGRAEGADLHGASVIPGLVDCGVSAVGYAESPLVPHPFDPEAAFAAMCLRFGVTSVIDVNNTLAGLAYLGSLAGRCEGPRVLAAGGRLSSAPSSRQDVLVDAESVAGVIDAQRAAGASLISLGAIEQQEILDAVLRQARRRSVPVAISRQVPRETPGLLFAPAGTLAEVDEIPVPSDEIVSGATLLAPQLEAVARWTVDGLMTARDAAMAAAFLPYSRNFARSGGVMGRRIGRNILTRYYGDRDPSAVMNRERPATAALQSRRCLASSGAGAAGLIPGASLWAELACLHETGGDDADVLFAATGAADALLGEAGVGRIHPGYHADLLVLDAPGRGRDPGGLWEHATHVVVGGQPASVETMAADVSVMIDEAMKAEQ